MTHKKTRRTFLKSATFSALLVGGALASALSYLALARQPPEQRLPVALGEVSLPQPRTAGRMSLEESIARRRSRRQYVEEPITLDALSQLLWAAQGITAPHEWVGLRTSPSAGGLYPLEVYVVVKPMGIIGLDGGVYHYNPQTHSLTLKAQGNFTRELMAAAVNQEWVGNAAVNIVITALFSRTTVKYGERGVQYVWQESGHVGQNIYLQATARGLGTTVIGAFFELEVQRILGIPSEEKPVYIVTVGVPST